MIYFVYMGSLLTALLFLIRARRRHFDFPLPATWDMTLALMVGGFGGARLLHVFFEDWDFYKENLFNIFYFWYGGFVFYGGVIGAIVSSILFLSFRPHTLKKNSFLQEWFAWANFFTPVISLGYAFGRVGCQIAGCCYGRVCDLPWAIAGLHPTALYLSVSEFFIFIFLTQLEKMDLMTLRKNLFLTWIFLNSLARFLIEPLRGDFRGAAIAGWSISSWLSFVLIVVSGAALCSLRSPRDCPRDPGRV